MIRFKQSPKRAQPTGQEPAPWIGIAAILAGIFPIAAATGLIQVDPDSMHAPRWVIASAGGLFLLAGAAILSRRHPFLPSLILPLLLTLFAAVFGWVGLGPGEREFDGGLPFVSGDFNTRLGRGLFGSFGILIGLVALYAWLLFYRQWLAQHPYRKLTALAGLLLAAAVVAHQKPARNVEREMETVEAARYDDVIASLYQSKLSNQDYLAWKSGRFSSNRYQNFREEDWIKQARAMVAQRVAPPEGVGVREIPIPKRPPPSIDGRLDDPIWNDALRLPLEESRELNVVLLAADDENLYLGCDAPGETTEEGFDQFRFYFHLNLTSLLHHERVMLSRGGTLRSGRKTGVEWAGEAPDAEDERWKRLPIDDGDIFGNSETSTSLRNHRQYEARLDLKEIGISAGVAFAAFAELETDPLRDREGKFNRRVELGLLGNARAPIWLRIGSSRAQARKDVRELDGSLNLDGRSVLTAAQLSAEAAALEKESTAELEQRLAQAFQAKLANPDYVRGKSRRGLPTNEQQSPEERKIKIIRSALARRIRPPAGGHPFKVPSVCSDAPKIDGEFSEGEWRSALTLAMVPETSQTTLKILSDERRLFLACDAPGETTAGGWDQFRFYIHPNLSPLIVNERVHLGNERGPLGGIRQTTLRWNGPPGTSAAESWKKFPLIDWNIFRDAYGASLLNVHRRYEAVLDLAESGLHVKVPFAAFVEVETDPKDDGQRRERVLLGKLGSQDEPLWFQIDSRADCR